MDCLNIRRTLLAVPNAQTAEIQQHLASCPDCKAFAVALSGQESDLLAALEIPVPEQLLDRILLNVALEEKNQWRLRLKGYLEQVFSKPALWRYGAIVSAIFALVIWSQKLDYEKNLNWGEVILAHTLGEDIGHEMGLKASISPQTLQRALAEYGFSTTGDLGTVRYLDHCALPGGRGLHIVLQVPQIGEVSLIVPPQGQNIKEVTVEREGLAAQILQIHSKNLGIVTSSPDSLREIKAFLHAHVKA